MDEPLTLSERIQVFGSVAAIVVSTVALFASWLAVAVTGGR